MSSRAWLRTSTPCSTHGGVVEGGQGALELVDRLPQRPVIAGQPVGPAGQAGVVVDDPLEEAVGGFGLSYVVVEAVGGVFHRHGHPQPPVGGIADRGGEGILQPDQGLVQRLASHPCRFEVGLLGHPSSSVGAFARGRCPRHVG